MPRVDTTVEYRRQQVATRYLRGELQSEIARVFGVSQQQISQDLKAILVSRRKRYSRHDDRRANPGTRATGKAPPQNESGADGAASPVWAPYPHYGPDRPHPQRMAYESPADVLIYGGQGGAGKTELLLGTAGTCHWRAIIFRREFARLSGMIDRSREIYNAHGDTSLKDSYNENLHRWRLRDGRQIQFAGMKEEDDRFNFQGRPHDLYGFDEGTEFSESQIRFVIGWCRSTRIDPSTGKPQRCRVIITCQSADERGWRVDCRVHLAVAGLLVSRSVSAP
jgi:hypothetical protein